MKVLFLTHSFPRHSGDAAGSFIHRLARALHGEGVETRVVAPSRRHIWIAGYHRWDGNAYVWVPGRWELPPAHRRAWVRGHWVHERRNGWYWVDGHWR